MRFASPADTMQYALRLATRGLGAVEPNPPVGAVLVNDAGELLGAGYHQQYGGPHAEVFALREAGDLARGATLYGTLEPCSHHGKTPPCAEAVIAAGVRRVVIAARDLAPHVNGGGFRRLREAGIEVEEGLLRDEALFQLAPFFKRQLAGKCYVQAKWAMTLDGRIAARTGHSQWISGEESRGLVHQLRGRMDGIVVGIQTALADDPLLTARPPGPRTAARIVLDRQARLPLSSQLVRTARETPLLVAVGEAASVENLRGLEQAGAEILRLPANQQISHLLQQLSARGMTHLLVEGGGTVLGSFFDAGEIDEYHVFIAPKLVGGQAAVSPLQGLGLPQIPQASQFLKTETRTSGADCYLHAYALRRWFPAG